MPPSMIEDVEDEAKYLGLCSVIVSIIALSPNGTLGDPQLNKYLVRMNLEVNAGGLGKTEEVLKKMCQQGYIQKIVEKNVDEETIDWKVGPRGKVEMANMGIQGLVLEVYGDDAPEDLNKRLERSLGLEIKRANANRRETVQEEEDEEEPEDGDPGPSSRRASGRRR